MKQYFFNLYAVKMDLKYMHIFDKKYLCCSSWNLKKINFVFAQVL